VFTFCNYGFVLAKVSRVLGASLRLRAKATSNDPRQLGPWVHIIFVCTRLFCRWSNGDRILQRPTVEGSGEQAELRCQRKPYSRVADCEHCNCH
jgi:hypothetical protein